MGKLLDTWADEAGVNDSERCRRLVDLFTVSVLLDAGAGDYWKYTEADTGAQVIRSEGLAVASLHMFRGGAFSSDPKQPFRCDGEMMDLPELHKTTPALTSI